MIFDLILGGITLVSLCGWIFYVGKYQTSKDYVDHWFNSTVRANAENKDLTDRLRKAYEEGARLRKQLSDIRGIIG